jgi:hypothetical protein
LLPVKTLIGLAICVSARRGISIKYCDENNVHWRTLISAVLILMLLPLSSLAAVCGVNCRTNGMPDMAMNAPSPHAGQNAGPGAHHHHESTPGSDPDVISITSVSHQLVASLACCAGLLPTLTSPCVTAQNDLLKEQPVSKCGRNSGIVQSQVSDLLPFFKERLNRHSIPLSSMPSNLSESLSLRI